MAVSIVWDDSAWLMRALDSTGTPIFTWTYTMLEKWYGDVITPHIYAAVTNFIKSELDDSDFQDLRRGIYNPEPLLSHAIDYYRYLDEATINEMRNHILEKLEVERDRAEHKEHMAMNWVLDVADLPEKYECLADELTEMARGLVKKYSEKRKACDRMIIEETGMEF